MARGVRCHATAEILLLLPRRRSVGEGLMLLTVRAGCRAANAHRRRHRRGAEQRRGGDGCGSAAPAAVGRVHVTVVNGVVYGHPLASASASEGGHSSTVLLLLLKSTCSPLPSRGFVGMASSCVRLMMIVIDAHRCAIATSARRRSAAAAAAAAGRSNRSPAA